MIKLQNKLLMVMLLSKIIKEHLQFSNEKFDNQSVFRKSKYKHKMQCNQAYNNHKNRIKAFFCQA